jgi:hypothetical protein
MPAKAKANTPHGQRANSKHRNADASDAKQTADTSAEAKKTNLLTPNQ